MINYNLLTLFSEYQTVSIIFISTFLTIICLATKKSVENAKSPSPVFNILPNDTLLIDSNDNDIEVISLSKQLKSKIPIRKNQINNNINNSVTSINSNSFTKSFPKNSISIINEKNDFKKSKQKDDDSTVNNYSFMISNAPLNNSTPINNSSMNSSKNGSSKLPQHKIKSIDEEKNINILKPSKKQTVGNSNEEISEIDNLDSEVIRINHNDSISRSTVPKRNKIITTFPAKPKIIKPPSLRNDTQSIKNDDNNHEEDSVSQPIDTPKFRRNQNNKFNSDLTPIQIPQPTQKIQPPPLSVTKLSANDINRFNNSIIALDGTIQVKPETVKSLTIGIPKINLKNNINKPFSPPTNESNDNKGVKLVSKLKKSNLAKDKSNYRLLQNENPIRKNKKSVKFHNKVEVWARTPTFLYSDKSFSGINKEPEYYDDFYNDSDNPRLIEPVVKPTRAIIIDNEPNSYSSRLKSKLEAKTEPKYTPTTTRRASSFPVNRNSNGFMGSEESKRNQFLQTPSPVLGQNENVKSIGSITTIRKPFKKIYSAPTK